MALQKPKDDVYCEPPPGCQFQKDFVDVVLREGISVASRGGVGDDQ